MIIRIITRDSEILEIPFSVNTTLSELRQEIWDRTGVCPTYQSFVHGRGDLRFESQDDGILTELGVEDGMALQLIEDGGGDAEEYFRSAVQYSNNRARRALIEREGEGLDVNFRDRVGRENPLFWVEDEDLMETLAGVGANVNARDTNGFPVLHTILSQNTLVTPFLQGGANVNCRSHTYFPKSVIESAIEAQNEGLFQELIESGARIDFPVPYVTTVNWSNLLRSVLR